MEKGHHNNHHRKHKRLNNHHNHQKASPVHDHHGLGRKPLVVHAEYVDPNLNRNNQHHKHPAGNKPKVIHAKKVDQVSDHKKRHHHRNREPHERHHRQHHKSKEYSLHLHKNTHKERIVHHQPNHHKHSPVEPHKNHKNQRHREKIDHHHKIQKVRSDPVGLNIKKRPTRPVVKVPPQARRQEKPTRSHPKEGLNTAELKHGALENINYSHYGLSNIGEAAAFIPVPGAGFAGRKAAHAFGKKTYEKGKKFVHNKEFDEDYDNSNPDHGVGFSVNMAGIGYMVAGEKGALKMRDGYRKVRDGVKNLFKKK